MPPVLERELRVQARLKRTFWLRSLTGLALAVALFVQMVDVGSLLRAMGFGARAPDGAQLFASLHTIISIVLLFAAPLVAADSLSKERRDGTLGLLALTPLKPFEVVIGKTLAHVIRLFSLWLLSVPLLLIPVLLGGVNWVDVKCAVGIELIILLGGLAAGLVATSVADRWTTAAALALLLTWVVGQTLVTGTGLAAIIVGEGKPGLVSVPDERGLRLLAASVVPWAAATGLMSGGFGQQIAACGNWVVQFVNYALLAGIGFSLSALGLALAIAAARVKRSFRSEPPSAKTEARRRRWRDVPWLRAAREFQRRRWLATNPARWLFGYSPFSDLSRWGWAALVLTSPIVFAFVGGHMDGNWLGLIVMQPMFLALSASLSAAASFRREIEEGTLELLLVSGLPATDLVSGRIRQLWSVTALALGLSAFWVVLGAGLSSSSFEADLLLVWFAGAVSVFGVVPIGVRYAVRRLSPLHGWFWTVLTAVFPPLLLGAATATMFWGMRRFGNWDDGVGRFAYGVGFTLTQFGLAWTWRWLAANDLHTRLYMLKPFQCRPT